MFFLARHAILPNGRRKCLTKPKDVCVGVYAPPAPYPGNSGAVDQVCLQNKPNSSLRGEKIHTSRSSLLLSSPRAIQYFQNHKCTMLPKINIFQGILPRILLLQILKSTMLSISHTAKIVKLNNKLP